MKTRAVVGIVMGSVVALSIVAARAHAADPAPMKPAVVAKPPAPPSPKADPKAAPVRPAITTPYVTDVRPARIAAGQTLTARVANTPSSYRLILDSPGTAFIKRRLDEMTTSAVSIPIPPDVPPGRYTLAVGDGTSGQTPLSRMEDSPSFEVTAMNRPVTLTVEIFVSCAFDAIRPPDPQMMFDIAVMPRVTQTAQFDLVGQHPDARGEFTIYVYRGTFNSPAGTFSLLHPTHFIKGNWYSGQNQKTPACAAHDRTGMSTPYLVDYFVARQTFNVTATNGDQTIQTYAIYTNTPGLPTVGTPCVTGEPCR